MKKSLMAAAAAVSLVAFPLQATALLNLTVTDTVYGNYSATLDSAATTPLTWSSAGYHWNGTIGLTNAAGTILYQIVTNNDAYSLFGAASGNSAIGQSCSGFDTTCVVVPQNQDVSLYSAVNSVNGGNGICCNGGSNIVVRNLAASAVPEPATWGMMIVGFGMMGMALRRRRATQVTFG